MPLDPVKLAAKHRRQNLKRYYGITADDWDALFEAQDGRCALCRTNNCPTGRRLAVDHNHDTNQVRGLLCYRCNAFVAMAEEDPMRVPRLQAYLDGRV